MPSPEIPGEAHREVGGPVEISSERYYGENRRTKAKGEAKAAKIEQSIAEMCTDYERRSGELKEAWELTR